MNSFEFCKSDQVLLLGEGNFSFSCCLLKLMVEKGFSSNFSNVYVTCFQNELSPLASDNVNYLRAQGAEVLLGVDATKLQDHETLQFMKFEKIIFNFPHVGGKMKIHLNRALLCNFFTSCPNVLTPGGKVLVTLCSGQGGTGFENSTRRWDDTWQIVEQAAHGNFVLSHVDYFPSQMFSDYQPVGYRGREQKFCISSSVFHVFRRAAPPISVINDDLLSKISNYHVIENDNDLRVSYAHKLAILKSPFKNCNSLQNFLTNRLREFMETYLREPLCANFNLAYHTNYKPQKAPCYFRSSLHSLRSSLAEVLPKCNNSIVFEGLVFDKLGPDFSSIGARCQAIVGGSFQHAVIKDFFAFISDKFQFNGKIEFIESENEFYVLMNRESLMTKKVAYYEKHLECTTINIDEICLFLFNVSIKELWAKDNKFNHLQCKLNLPSLYSRVFSFDICFSSINDLDETEFFNLLHQIPDQLIDSVKLLNVFQHPSRVEKSYCYRIDYRSYEKPLYRKRVIDFQHVVIKALIENKLNVTVH